MTWSIAVCVFVAPVMAAESPAPAFPSKPIRIVVPAAPGGASDLLSRMLGGQMTKALGQQVIIDNRAGAGGQIGCEAVVRAAADGHTLLFWDYGSLTIAPAVRPTFPFNPSRDFKAVTVVSYSPHLLAVHPSVPASDVRGLIALAKAHPGKLNFAAANLGAAPHLAGALFAQRSGISWEYIPAKGGAQAISDVASGQSDVLFNSALATLPHVRSGRLKLLGVSSAQRVKSLPDTPTIIESGVSEFVTGSWQGMLAPAATPPDAISTLNREVVKILAQSDMRSRLEAMSADTVANSPEQAHRFLVGEQTRWADVVKRAGIKLE
ncbi:MAG: tripartite tricarboxylate transporter substrate binding protein [Burkholderiales bacterium]|nr:tripartite tricarboxylate transporter substrate binding protein [Burkholderiales bacterium]